jgi:diaminopimelate decarboxylase
MSKVDRSEQLAAAAAHHGTPVFIYDAAGIASAIHKIRRHFNDVPLRIYFSAKANPAVGMAALMQRHRLGLDACSPGDLRLAELAGVPRDHISYTGFGATDAELLQAAEAAGDVVLDSVEEIERCAAMGIHRPIGLRINPGITAGFHGHVSAATPDAKFGIASASLPKAAAKAAGLGLPVVGLHAHLGSDIFDTGPYRALLTELAGLAGSLPGVRWINLGGGWGTPRHDTDAGLEWADVAAAAQQRVRLPDGRLLELRIEPGGHLTMDAGVLVGRVLAIKAGDPDRLTTIVTDASTNHLPSVLLYGAHHGVSVVSGSADGNKSERYRIAGNLMQAGDVLSPSVELPSVSVGSLLSFSHAGAYAACRAAVFNERPRAAEVLVDGTAMTLLRRAETVDELFTRDVLPSADRPHCA